MLETFTITAKETQEHFEDELTKIRAGRAHPSLLADIKVDAYGAIVPLVQLASVSVSDVRTLVIEPYDKSLTKEIEKTLLQSPQGITPTVDGGVVRITLPQMTEERRKDLVKIIHQKLETSRVRVRKAREELKKEIDAKTKNGGLTEDDKYSLINELDSATKASIDKMEESAEKKEKEVMTV